MDHIIPLNNEKPTKKNIVYSGALTEYSGILTLLEAMKYVDPEAVLEIYGSGPLVERVKDFEKKNSNIKYMGMVENDKMVRIQQSAYLLINPRHSDDPIAMVTFPSKMFEYMLSGRPVLTTKLNGLSEGFLKNLFLIEEESPEGFADAINNIIASSDCELLEKALQAREFVIKEKNWEHQVNDIVDFLRYIKK